MIQQITTHKAPAAIGPYSQALKAGPFLFVSGQIPIDPETGHLIDSDMKLATNRCLDNIEAILKEAGLTLESVVRTEIFLRDIADFSTMNETYAKYFCSPNPPARQTVQVAALPKNARIEISCIALYQI